MFAQKLRKKSNINKNNIFDEIKVAKEEGQIESLEEIEEEQEDEDLLDFDPDDRDYDSIRDHMQCASCQLCTGKP